MLTFPYGFQHLWVPAISALATFCMRVLVFQCFLNCLTRTRHIYACFCAVALVLKFGISICLNDFYYFCILEILNVNISNWFSLLLSAGNVCSGYFLRTCIGFQWFWNCLTQQLNFHACFYVVRRVLNLGISLFPT